MKLFMCYTMKYTTWPNDISYVNTSCHLDQTRSLLILYSAYEYNARTIYRCRPSMWNCKIL